jgi:hypothetical protein
MDKNALLGQQQALVEHEIKGIGTIKLRTLSLEEVRAIGGMKVSESVKERKFVAKSFVDPKMTEKDIEQWMNNAPGGQVAEVMKLVGEISGIGEGSAEAAYKSTSD